MNMLKQQYTVEDLVAFVMKHRRNKVFRGWTEDQVRESIVRGIECHSMGYVVNHEGALVGLAVGIRNANKVLYVSEVLTIERGALQALMKLFTLLFPMWQIVCHRRGKEITYDMGKLLSKTVKI